MVSNHETSSETPLGLVRATYHELMGIPENELSSADSMVATWMASKLHRNDEPVCVVIVAPSGWGKTEMIRPIMDWDGITVNFSTMTSKALASGSPGAAKSLLHKLDRRVLVIKDFTTIFNNPEARQIFFSTIRDAYDGSFDKFSGASGDAVRVRSRFVIYSGMVPSIYTQLERDQDLGYRYLLVWLRRSFSRADQDEIQRQINLSWNSRIIWRDNIKTRVRIALKKLISRYNIGPDAPPMRQHGDSDEVFNLRSRCYEDEQRTGVHRIQWPGIRLTPDYCDWVVAASRVISYLRIGSGDAIKTAENVPSYTDESERAAPFRAQKQLNILVHMRAVADFREATNEADIEFGRTICRDTMVPGRRLLLDALARDAIDRNFGFTTGGLCSKIRRDPNYVGIITDHLLRTGFLQMQGKIVRLSEAVFEDMKVGRLIPRD